MDFFDTIEQYENKLGDAIRRKLNHFINTQNVLHPSTYTNDNNNNNFDVYNKKLFEEITLSKPLNQMILNKKKKKVKIYALNKTQINQMTNCFDQKGLLSYQCDQYYNKKSEFEVMKKDIITMLHQDIRRILNDEMNKPDHIASSYTNNNNKSNSNTMIKMLNPIKKTNKNRYKESIAYANYNNINGNKKRILNQQNVEYDGKENKSGKNKQESHIHQQQNHNQQQLLLQHKKKVFQWKDDELIMKMNDGRNKFNLENKYGTKGKNSKRILSCRVIIQDKKS